MILGTRTVLATTLVALLLTDLVAQSATTRDDCDRQFGVRIGNEGKDVIWVPTHDKLVSAMLTAANVGPSDYVIDLGAGDGKIPITAARDFGARALGVEYDAKMVALARCYIGAEGVADRVEIREADIFNTDLTSASVITLYLLPKLNRKLRPTLLRLAPGTRILSNRFTMGSWQPDEVIQVPGVANTAYLWIVPRQLAGVWNVVDTNSDARLRVRFSQSFQRLSATVVRPRQASIRAIQLRGDRISFTLRMQGDDQAIEGFVSDTTMELRSADGTLYRGTRG